MSRRLPAGSEAPAVLGTFPGIRRAAACLVPEPPRSKPQGNRPRGEAYQTLL